MIKAKGAAAAISGSVPALMATELLCLGLKFWLWSILRNSLGVGEVAVKSTVIN